MRLALALAALVAGATSVPRIEEVAVVVNMPNALCSGTVVQSSGKRSVILTAKHCLEGGVPRSVDFLDGDTGKVQRILESPKRDLILLVTKTKYVHPSAHLNLITAGLTPITLFGISDDVFWGYSPGYIMSEFLVEADYGKFSQSTLPIACASCDVGGSGGAVFEDGNIVGVLVAGRHAKGVSYMLPAGDVLKFLYASRQYLK